MHDQAAASGVERVRRWWWATPLAVRTVPAVGVLALAVWGGLSVLPSGEPPVHAETPPLAPATSTTVPEPPPPAPLPPPPPPPPPAPEPEPPAPAPVTTTPPPPETTEVEPPPPPAPAEEVVFWGERCDAQGDTAEHVDGTPMVCDYVFGSLRYRPA